MAIFVHTAVIFVHSAVIMFYIVVFIVYGTVWYDCHHTKSGCFHAPAYFTSKIEREFCASNVGGGRGKKLSALRSFSTSPLRAPTLFELSLFAPTLLFRSTLQPFLVSAFRAPTHFRSALSAPVGFQRYFFYKLSVKTL